MDRGLLPIATALLLLAAALAGCLGGDAPPAPSNASNPGERSAPSPAVQDGEEMASTSSSTGMARAQPGWTLTGFRGAEPTIGATGSGALFVNAAASFDSPDHTVRSTDGGRSWAPVFTYQGPMQGQIEQASHDPMLWVDALTDEVLVLHMWEDAACTTIAASADDGETWERREPACGVPFTDHPKLIAAPPGPGTNPLAGVEHPSVLMLCHNKLVATDCTASYDGGDTWPVERTMFTLATSDCSGINGHPAPAPDGTVAVPVGFAGLSCGAVQLAVTEDSGLTWTVRSGPEGHGSESQDPELAFAPDGTLYLLWRGDDHLPRLARSPDLGASWEGPWTVASPDTTSAMFQALAVGDHGRVAMAYLGTNDTTKRPGQAPAGTAWHLHMSISENADGDEPTFQRYQVTPDGDPVQVGRICEGIGSCRDGSRNLLDFIDATVAPDGTFYVAYTEGCVDECATMADPAPSDSRAQRVAVGWLDGWRLDPATERAS